MAEWLEARSDWIGRAALEGVEMVVLDGFPGIIRGHGRVIGDVCRIHAGLERQVLRVLDDYEGIDPVLGYERRVVTIRISGEPLNVWAYFYCGPSAGRQRVENGDWLAWMQGGSQDETMA